MHGITEGENTIDYAYNGDGQRVSKTVNDVTTEYYYNGSILAGQKSGEDTLVFMYDNNSDIFGFIYNGTEYYYIKNAQNDVTAIADAGGNVLVNYTYDAWGKITSITKADDTDITNLEDDIFQSILDVTTGETMPVLDENGNPVTSASTEVKLARINPILYRSYYYDSETEWYYLNTRYYSADMCRFLNSDSYIDNREIITQNLFQYCGNNPVKNGDLRGNLFGAIVGIGLLVVGVAVILSGCSSKSTTQSTTTKPPTSSSTTQSTTRPQSPSSNEKSYAATVYAEAGGQNRRTKQAVAHVMNNRIGKRSTWTDIVAVISAKSQFDGYNSEMFQAAMNYYNNGICDNPIEKAAMDECMEVIIPIYRGEESDITDGALYFHSLENPDDWKYHDSYTQVYISGTENFWFYK